MSLSRASSAGSGRILTLVLALTVTVAPAAEAQSGLKTNRRWLFALIGAAVAGVPSYAFAGDGSVRTSCTSKTCVGIAAGLIGAGIGFLIGAEFDSRYKRRMAAGPSLSYSFQDVPLDLVPDRLTSFPGGAAVIGLGGARIVLRDGTVRRRAATVRGIEDLAVVPSQDLLILSTFSNLLTFPIGDESAPGQVVDERGGGSLQLFQDNLAVAGLDSLRLLRIQRTAGEVSVATLTEVESFNYITDMSFSDFGRVGWVLMENRLASYTADLEKIAETELPAAGRSVRARGSRLAVAAGSNGVYVLDAADPAAPRVVQHYSGVSFAFAADLDGDLLYVAAGSDGVVVVDLGGAVPTVIGVARQTRFATDVVVTESGEVWILDRDGRRVQLADLRGRAGGETRGSRGGN